MSKLKRVALLAVGGLVAATTMTGLSVVEATPAQAAGPVFGVMNTSETPPDGVWFRNSPHTADTDRATGHGVYAGDSVQLQCYAWGDSVGAYNDTLWYYVNNLTRPTVSSNGQANVGYLNAHYVNDGQNANVVDAGVGQCGAAPAPPTPSPVVGFYSPFNLGGRGNDGQVEDLQDQAGVYTAYRRDWDACSAPSDNPYSTLRNQLAPGQYFDRVGGWSFGRVGPSYLIHGMQKFDPNQLRQLDYIILIDPGSYSDLSVCDAVNSSGSLYATWLKSNPNARLVVLSGSITQQQSSKGIQQIYFDPIRFAAPGTDIRSRVLVCNYSTDHYSIYHAGQYWIKHVISANSCPTLNYNGTRWQPTATWHP